MGDAGAASEQRAPETATVRKIVNELDGLPPERARFVAVFAYILSRVAQADLSISDEETETMERIVEKIGGLPAEQSIIVVQMAKTQNLLFGGTENFSVTQEFNRIADKDQKLQLLECLFAVSAADDEITSAEDQTIRQIADELLLEHADFIAVRSGFRDHLSVLRGGD
jgi:uncharacterized tellurite resistance protein B-like protein